MKRRGAQLKYTRSVKVGIRQIGKIFLEKVKRLGSSSNYNLLCVAKMPVET